MSDDIEVQILSAPEARSRVHRWATHLISLTDPGDTKFLVTSPRTDLCHLVLELADVTDPDHPHVARPAHIQQLIDLGRDLPAGATLLCHCRGGIGRSPAAAAIALTARGMTPTEALDTVLDLRRQAQPNPWMLLLADEALGRPSNDGLFTGWLNWARRQPHWRPISDKLVSSALDGDGAARRKLVTAQTHKHHGTR
jgi:predicted protein tyrosine phosphatase